MIREQQIRTLSDAEVSQVAGGDLLNRAIDAALAALGNNRCLLLLRRDGSYIYCGNGYGDGSGGIVPR